MKESVYYPESINLELLMQQNEPFKGFDIEEAKFFLHNLCSVMMKNKSKYKEKEFIPLSAKVLQSIGFHDYRKYVDWFIKNNVLVADGIYSPKNKCSGYRFSDTVLFNDRSSNIIKKDYVSSYKMIKRLKKSGSIQQQRSILKNKALYNWLTGIEIDEVNATDKAFKLYKSNRETKKVNSRLSLISQLMAIGYISDGKFFFIRDENVFRIHSNLTNLKSELRNYITFKGQPLVSIDLKNSQPFLSSLILSEEFWSADSNSARANYYNINTTYKNNTTTYNTTLPTIMLEEIHRVVDTTGIEQFVDLTQDGRLYEYMGGELIKRNIAFADRRELKSIMFGVLYSDNKFYWQKDASSKRLFSDLFPEVYSLLSTVKSKNKEDLPILLQRIESKLIIDRICARITKQHRAIPILTVHDSIVTTVGNESLVRQIMEEECKKMLGIIPQLKNEYWQY